MIGRQAHGIASIGDKMYVVGGYSFKTGNSVADIEEFDTVSGSSKPIAKLEHFVTTKANMYFNVECCSVVDKKYLLVGGTWFGDDDRKRQTLQLVSLEERKCYGIVLPRKNSFAIFAVLHVDGICIALAGDYTAVCSVQAIKEGTSDRVSYKDKYIVPNNRCGIALTPNGDVLVVGGHPHRSDTHHYLYRASVADIVNNDGSGWERVMPPTVAGPLDLCWIRAYTYGAMDI